MNNLNDGDFPPCLKHAAFMASCLDCNPPTVNEYTFIHDGVEYSRLSDRGRQVWDSINSDKNK